MVTTGWSEDKFFPDLQLKDFHTRKHEYALTDLVNKIATLEEEIKQLKVRVKNIEGKEATPSQ